MKGVIDMIIMIIVLIVYSIGMIVADKYWANAFIDGVDESYEELMEDGYPHRNFLIVWDTLICVLAKIFIPLLWPVVTIVLIIMNKNHDEEEEA
jgi:ABC-type maltose transport system permease subunit